MASATLSRSDIDSQAACDQEPTHAPASIQPHGFLIALGPDGRVAQASDNVDEFTGRPLQDILGQRLERALGAQAQHIQSALRRDPPAARPEYLGSVRLCSGRCFDVLAHRHDDLLILEFEEVAGEDAADFHVRYPLISRFLSRLGESDSVADMSDLAAREIRRLTGFGRVLVYRFDNDGDGDGDGEVIAESRDPDCQTVLHQRFPASDMPRQARALHLDGRVCLTPNANYQPAHLVPPRHPITGAQNDLRFAVLRSVSPEHLQYMCNMGTLADMSISLTVKGRLWGLISCHHATPAFVRLEVRSACEQLGQMLALRIESKEDSDETQARLEQRRLLVTMLSRLTQSTDVFHAARGVAPELLRLGGASGVALLVDGKLVCIGETPEEAQVRTLTDWLAEHARGEIFHTHELGSLYPGGMAIRQHASGILALSLSRVHKHYLIWFRPERVFTIDWAGDPTLKRQVKTAPLTSDMTMAAVMPSMRFSVWRETVIGCSERWRSSEIETALELRAALLGSVLERAEQMAELADELGRVNQELDVSPCSVSHDLRAPLHHIDGFCDLLLEADTGSQTAERRRHLLRNIKDSARFAARLVDDLLGFSHIGRAALQPARLNLRELLDDCRERLKPEIGERRIDWEIGPLPEVEADPNLLQRAVCHLLHNAIKYTSTREIAHIRIHAKHDEDAQCNPGHTVFHIEDNGVGFSSEYAHKLFGVFQRVHPTSAFDGTGIGLANVRRIIERHGGRVWASGEPDRGARFSFFLPSTPAPSP